MLVVSRFQVPPDTAAEFLDLARQALHALLERPGCLGGEVGRAADDAALWVLVTRWARVGDYRRALSSTPVKLTAVPLMYRCIDEPSAYEVVLEGDDAGLRERASDVHRQGPDRPE